MKMLFAAIAMTIATPALAQSAAPTDAHAAHAADAAQTANGSHAGHGTAHGKMMQHCDKKSGGEETACPKKPAANPHAGHDKSKADPHAGHDMSSH